METKGSKGKCSICKKPIKSGEEWHFVNASNNPDVGKERQHYDCENPKEKY